MTLEKKFRELKQKDPKSLIIGHVARVCFSGSTVRGLRRPDNNKKKTISSKIRKALKGIEVNQLPKIKTQEKFKEWFEKQLEKVFVVIPCRTSGKKSQELSEDARRWGYAAKILCLFLKEVVEHRRYFTSEDAEKARRWLYCPIDSIVMSKLRECNVSLPFSQIKGIDKDKFYNVQKQLGNAAKNEGVSRILFDYVWSERE